MPNVKDINFNYSTETVIKYWKNHFYVTHIKEIIANSIVISIALLIYFFSEYIVLAELIILFCALYIIVIFHFYYYAALSKIKKQKKYYDEMTTVLSEDNIQLICKLSESKIKWEEFTQVFEGKEYYLLYNSVRGGVLIPKSVFITEEDKHWFEDKLKKQGLMIN